MSELTILEYVEAILVVLAFHRGGSNAQQMVRSCGLNDKVL
jgi:hypothetical protein